MERSAIRGLGNACRPSRISLRSIQATSYSAAAAHTFSNDTSAALLRQSAARADEIAPEPALATTFRRCSPDGAQRNPGAWQCLPSVPDFASLHPGYKLLGGCRSHLLERHLSCASSPIRST